MKEMFFAARKFNQSLTSFNTSRVRDMSLMFYVAETFNQSLAHFDTSRVRRMYCMFCFAYDFQQNISSWNTSSVITMNSMFLNTKVFNTDISSWNVSKVRDFAAMFNEAVAFNQSISSWNMTSACNMEIMFSGAAAFNQNLNRWGDMLDGKPCLNSLGMFFLSGCPSQTDPEPDKWCRRINFNARRCARQEFRQNGCSCERPTRCLQLLLDSHCKDKHLETGSLVHFRDLALRAIELECI